MHACMQPAAHVIFHEQVLLPACGSGALQRAAKATGRSVVVTTAYSTGAVHMSLQYMSSTYEPTVQEQYT